MQNSDTQALQPIDPEAENRFVGGFGEQIRNSDLLCARCANLWEEETAECEIYSQKPLAVLRGEDACPDFVPRGGPAQEEAEERRAAGGEDPARLVGGIGEQIRNSDLLCARCANLWEEETAECEIYSQKPLAVLRGEAACPDFIPRDGPAQR